MNRLASNLRRLRLEKKLTQEQLAEAMGVTCAAVSKWERGLSFPDISLLIPLADILKVSLYDLLTGGEDNEQE